MGLTPQEVVALQANLRSPLQQVRLGYSGSWTTDADVASLSNNYFITLLSEKWQAHISPSGKLEFKAQGNGVEVYYMTPTDVALRSDAQFLAIAQSYAEDNHLFLAAFKSAWTKMMNADRFKGPAGNVCGK